MKPKNQFEVSINFLTNNIPGYIRKLYEGFLILENELYTQLNYVHNSNPYSADSFAGGILGGPEFIQIIKSIMSEENQIILQNYMQNLSSFDSMPKSVLNDEFEQERFETIDGGDLYAPVTEISSIISTFPYDDGIGPPLLYFKPIVLPSYYKLDIEKYGDKTSETQFFDTYTISDNSGNISLFDCLNSKLCIDINHVFSFFMNGICEHVKISLPPRLPEPGDEQNEYSWKLYTSIHTLIQSGDDGWNTFIGEFLNNYTRLVLGSATLTYLTYAGKLIGAKQNTYDWLYTTFIKDAVSDIEKGNYNDVDIMAFAGYMSKKNINHGGEPPITGNDNIIDKRYTGWQTAIQKNIDDHKEWDVNLLYKVLRLKYSNWCTAVNAVISISAANRCKNSTDEDYKKVFHGLDNTYGPIATAQEILKEYIGVYFSAYNVYAFPSGKNDAVGKAGIFIDTAVKRITDGNTLETIADNCINVFHKKCGCTKICKHPKTIKNYFISSSGALGSLYSTTLSKNVLADLFMMYTYIIILTGLYNNAQTILDEKDNLTGRSKKEFFFEIYNALLVKANDILNPNFYKTFSGIVTRGFDRSYGLYTNPYTGFNSMLKQLYSSLTDYYNKYNNYGVNDVTKQNLETIRNILDKIREPAAVAKNTHVYPVKKYTREFEEIQRRMLADLYDIHPLSYIARLAYKPYSTNIPAYKYDNNKIINAIPNFSYSRSGHLFPKNKITDEILTKVQFSTPKLFSSLESADVILKTVEDSALGNNANYSLLGSIGGAVTDEADNSIKYDALPDEDADAAIQFTSKESFNADLNRLKHIISVYRLEDRWNKAFADIVLKKELKPPKKNK
jgi:hypothetical protein